MSKQIVHKNKQETKKSKLLTRYEKLLKDIARKKKQHENLTEGIREVMPKITAELHPLSKSEQEWHVKKLIRLDEIFGEVTTPKMKSEMFVEYMIEEVGALLQESHKDDKQLKAIYKKYAREDFEQDRMQFELLADLINQETGFEVDADEIMEKGFEQYLHDNQESFAQQAAESREKRKSKSKKQTNAQLQEEEENKMLALDAKAIYFRLIKKYHPDLQQDPVKQKEYTEISKLVTKAYKDNDFMTLLQLQITYLDDTELDATALADDMLMRYNKILQGQLTEINMMLEMAKRTSGGMFEDFFDKDYKFSQKLFDEKKAEIEDNIESIIIEIEESHKQKKGWFKSWLSELKAIKEMEAFSFMFDLF
ncbi:hypothetical protein EGI22_01685 [Lacihabitans sp. LS3-19]|uniref:hypothetical protein n=1 Tax=Lacihabitans sp. LS3-19 TaxID=2487335 RepID=UPI0020CCFC50|nr:hypothetical protein [Lacihabitans sp. LS3-19]MCP9766600.1 hypothetical protein [Lacihabitans sp. LS3-19]